MSPIHTLLEKKLNVAGNRDTEILHELVHDTMRISS